MVFVSIECIKKKKKKWHHVFHSISPPTHPQLSIQMFAPTQACSQRPKQIVGREKGGLPSITPRLSASIRSTNTGGCGLVDLQEGRGRSPGGYLSPTGGDISSRGVASNRIITGTRTSLNASDAFDLEKV